MHLLQFVVCVSLIIFVKSRALPDGDIQLCPSVENEKMELKCFGVDNHDCSKPSRPGTQLRSKCKGFGDYHSNSTHLLYIPMDENNKYPDNILVLKSFDLRCLPDGKWDKINKLNAFYCVAAIAIYTNDAAH